MGEQPIRLKYLLQERHWQTYRIFCAEYDRAAREIDPTLAGRWPSRAQLHRWMAGELRGLPYPDHCRVLEVMFPGWSVAQMFERVSPDEVNRAPVKQGASESLSSESHPVAFQVFTDLNDEDNRAIAQRIRTSESIFFVAHTGYNAMVSQYQAAIRYAIERGAQIKVVVTNPDSQLMAQPELTRRLCPSIRQAGEIADVLATCRRHLDSAVRNGHAESNVQARVYSGPPTMNVLQVDGWLRVIPYLPLVDAAECPVFEHEFDPQQPSSLVGKYLLSLDRIWGDAEEVKLLDLDVN